MRKLLKKLLGRPSSPDPQAAIDAAFEELDRAIEGLNAPEGPSPASRKQFRYALSRIESATDELVRTALK